MQGPAWAAGRDWTVCASRCSGLWSRAALCVLLAASFSAHAQDSKSTGDAPSGGKASVTKRTGAHYAEDLVAARRLIEGGSYSQALPRLINITSRDQSSPQAIEAYYWTARAYHGIGSLTEARSAYERYLELAPEGPMAEECRTSVESIKTEVETAYVSEEDLAGLIAKVEAKVAEAPSDLPNRLLLADLYWKHGSYDSAASLYTRLLTEKPGLIQDRVVSQRMQQQGDGTWRVYTPAEAIRQDTENRPLTVYGTNSFRTTELRGDLRYYNVDFYHVSGQVVNQSTKPARNVAVDVSIYGFGNKVYDTQTVQLGSMPPGQHRTFAVRFDKFDNVNNVQRYETQLRYDQ